MAWKRGACGSAAATQGTEGIK